MNLKQKLTQATQDLKEQYLLKTRIHTENKYKQAVERSKWKEVDWCKYYNLTPKVANKGMKDCEFLTFPDGFYNSKQARIYHNDKDEATMHLRIGLDDMFKRAEKFAIIHYENSVIKLVDRLYKKGITDSDEIEIIQERLNVNFEAFIKSGKVVVRCWTIIAEGPVQQPHYRFLVNNVK